MSSSLSDLMILAWVELSILARVDLMVLATEEEVQGDTGLLCEELLLLSGSRESLHGGESNR